jgi:hypothetical protein
VAGVVELAVLEDDLVVLDEARRTRVEEEVDGSGEKTLGRVSGAILGTAELEDKHFRFYHSTMRSL